MFKIIAYLIGLTLGEKNLQGLKLRKDWKAWLGSQSSAEPRGFCVRAGSLAGFLPCKRFRTTLLQNPKGSAELWGAVWEPRPVFWGLAPFPPIICKVFAVTQERKSSPKSKFRGRTSRGRPRGYPGGRPGAKTSVRPSKPCKSKHFGADINDPKARTSMTPGGLQKNFGQKNFGLDFRSLVIPLQEGVGWEIQEQQMRLELQDWLRFKRFTVKDFRIGPSRNHLAIISNLTVPWRPFPH